MIHFNLKLKSQKFNAFLFKTPKPSGKNLIKIPGFFMLMLIDKNQICMYNCSLKNIIVFLLNFRQI
jgi:hypothetical protein